MASKPGSGPRGPSRGTVVGLTGFYGVAPDKIRFDDIPNVVAAMNALAAG